MDIITYSLCKKIASGAVSGISDLSISGQDLIITTNDGNQLIMHFPSPTELQLNNCYIDENKHLIMEFSDETVVDCGEIPLLQLTVDSTLNGTSKNPVQNKVIYQSLSDYAIITQKFIYQTLSDYATKNYVDEATSNKWQSFS